ncbi:MULTISPECIES: hypothetical protein [Pseudomonas]|jgi:hypothetical protein|uniref:DUF7210 family protein n=1 Tax=Pseudomonas TaxID=286 RepID=UPI0003902B6B|nr:MULTISPECIES: hypothetical protein [Pseudomonas]AUR80831.1 hypothetical protein TC7_062 [Pseudomonas phage TC7]MED5479680.1 hypothetical protein [Pseudomonadota bacterium]ASC96374.1 hypothetical protein CD796_07725 [Pseudomonas aeruginosa]AXR26937.1 hypothetical protein DZ894_04455 [Pseudomonas aeruginosa]AXR27565.1 hypothetical protein DZ894_07750 [Pseudomonas aeruginosa]
MDLRAIQPIYRGGRLVQPGEPFETTAEDGKALIQEGKAREPVARKAAAKQVKADQQAEK